MYGLIDYRGIHSTTSEGYFRLLGLARQLVGEPFLFARRGYPDELKLHFGTPVQSPGPKGRTITSGSYVLGAVASAWSFKVAKLGVTLLSGDPFASAAPADPDTWGSPLHEEKLDAMLASTGGPIMTGVEVQTHPLGYALSLAFSDGSALTILPSRETGPVPDWELFTPYDRYLRVGPGREWAYLPSDQPETAPG